MAVIASFSLLSWLGLWFDDADVFSHFRLHLAAIAALIAAASVLINLRIALIAALLVAINFGGTLYSHATFTPPASGVRLKILTLNVMSSAANSDAIAEMIDAEQPDFVLLQEVRPNRLGLLMQLRESYPWQAHCAFDDDCWVAVLSRHPPISSGAAAMSSEGAGLGWMAFGADLVDLTVATVHLPRPLTSSAHAHIDALAREAASIRGPMVIGGDFNATAWSGAMRSFSARSGLLPAGDIMPTWPLKNGRGVRCTVCIPQFQIDHIMVGPHVRLLSRRTGADVGSDHLPLVAEIEIVNGR